MKKILALTSFAFVVAGCVPSSGPGNYSQSSNVNSIKGASSQPANQVGERVMNKAADKIEQTSDRLIDKMMNKIFDSF